MKPYTGNNKFITILTYFAVVVMFASIFLEAYFSHTLKPLAHKLFIFFCAFIPSVFLLVGLFMLFSYIYKKYLFKFDKKLFR